ncbi:MAG: hypothetical protein LC804_25770 [Acidobacteria bacterium]|nr:hypothetical protein [Acidobacteriota bacterium]
MEQRRLRLGDILDDYCPRERRVTNHAVVAIINDQIKQTRCTTCDAEHPYKAAKVPRKKPKDAPGALYQQVLAGMPEQAEGQPLASTSPAAPTPAGDEIATDADPVPPAAPGEDASEPSAPAEEGPVHRPLLRAKLPRPEGQVATRPAPEFTIRQSGGRGGNFRDPDRQGYRGGRPSSNGGQPPHNAGAGRPAGPRHSRGGRGASGRPPGGSPQSGSRFDRSPMSARHDRASQPPRHGKKRSR